MRSYTTEGLWSAAGSAPSSFLFDEHESRVQEEGEVVEGTGLQTTDQDQAGQTEADADEEYRKRAEYWEDFISEHQNVSVSPGFVTTQRKRAWSGSAPSEGRNRPTRRPRCDAEGENGGGVRLPSIHELVGNPWDNGSAARSDRRRFPLPVLFSTPRRDHTPLSNHVYQSEANVSGQAPTPHRTSTVASVAHSHGRGDVAEERAGKPLSRATSRSPSRSSFRESAMYMDEDGRNEEDEPGLLKTPSLRQARLDRNRRELEELEERKRALKLALQDSQSHGRQTRASAGSKAEQQVRSAAGRPGIT